MTRKKPDNRRRQQGVIAPPSARSLAVEALIHILEKGAYANITVNQYLHKSQLKGPERGLFTELVYGVTRTHNTLDWALEHFLKQGIKNFTPPIRTILRMGAYQLLYLDRIPSRAVVHQGVELAKRYGHQGVANLVNGVLRNFIRKQEQIKFPTLAQDPVNHIVLKYSHPKWLINRWLKEFGVDATIELCIFNNQPSPLTIRVNTLKTTREGLGEKLAARGMVLQKSKYIPEGLIVEEWPGIEEVEEFHQGLFSMQDEGSMLVAHMLKPAKGARVIDACAAPGTKTTHLAQLMHDEGEILALDIHQHKIELIENSCRRLGIQAVKVKLLDAREMPKHIKEKIDYLLVDAPCSGLGVLGRRADARWRKSPAQLEELPILQGEILSSGAQILRPGGVLVYSTCSIAREENHDVINDFLEKHPDFQLEDLKPYLPASLVTKEDRDGMEKGMIQLLPHIHGVDGFFVARMRKTLK